MKRKLWIAAAVMVLLAVLWCGSAMADTEQSRYKLKGINGDIAFFPYLNKQMDIVYDLAVFEHYPDLTWEEDVPPEYALNWVASRKYEDPERTKHLIGKARMSFDQDMYIQMAFVVYDSYKDKIDCSNLTLENIHFTNVEDLYYIIPTAVNYNEESHILYIDCKCERKPYIPTSINLACDGILDAAHTGSFLNNLKHTVTWKKDYSYFETKLNCFQDNYICIDDDFEYPIMPDPNDFSCPYYCKITLEDNESVDYQNVDFSVLSESDCHLDLWGYNTHCYQVTPYYQDGKHCLDMFFRFVRIKYNLFSVSGSATSIATGSTLPSTGGLDMNIDLIWQNDITPQLMGPIGQKAITVSGSAICTDNQLQNPITTAQLEPEQIYYYTLTLENNHYLGIDYITLERDNCTIAMPGYDIECYAIDKNDNNAVIKFTIKRSCYTASFDSNGGSGEMGNEYIPFGFRYTLPENGFTAPAGKTFGIWHIPSGIYDGNGKRYYFLPGEEIMPANDFTAMPVWIDAPAEQVPATLTFRPAGNATGTEFNRTGYVGQPFTLPDCTFTGPEHTYFWRWRGVWFDNGAQVTQDYGENESVTVAAGGMTFTAVFTNEIPYKVTFSGNGYQLVYKGETATRPDDPVSSGYIFSGWYTDRTYSTAYNFSTPVTRSFTLYPKWETEPAQEYCTVRLDADEGTGYHEILVPKGGKFVLPSTLNYPMTPPAGQEFDTWAGYGKPGTVITVNNDMTIYAAWWDKPPLIFTEDSSAMVGGHLTVDIEEMASRSYMIRTALEDNTLTYEWYVGGSGQPEDEDSNRLEITPDMLHHGVQLVINYPGSFGTNAYYSENMYVLPAVCKVHFDTPNNDIPDQYVMNGQCAARPGIIPTYDDGHVFLGWFESLTNDTPFDFTQPVTDHTTVYPHWKRAGSCGENAYWEFEDNTLRIYGSGAMNDYGSDNHAPWYQFSKSITGIVVETGITYIGNYAFDGNDGFSKPVTVSLPAGLTSIGSNVFENCAGLKGLTIPYSVTDIGTGAFQGSGLKSIVIPEHVNEIKADTFNGCDAMTTAVLPSGLLRIGEGAFSHTGIRSLWLPSKVTSIGNEAFDHCENLTGGITIPASVQSIGADAFAYCRNLTSLKIMNGLTSIGNYAFENCTGLTTVTIPASVSSIGYAAFYGDTGLETVTIMNPDAQIDGSAFYGCTGLTLYGFAGSTTEIHAAANNIPFVPMNVDNPTFFLPSALTKIDSDVFAGISARGIVIPKNVTEITGNPFSNSGLTTVYGYPGTEAETFASDYGYYFVPIDDAWMARHKAK